MGYGEILKSAFDVYLFKAGAVKSLVKDRSAFGLGFATVAIAGAAGAIGMLNLVGIVVQPIFAIIGALIWVGLLHLLAKLFGGNATFGEFWNVGANMSVLGWIAVIPVLGPLLMFPLWIWAIIATVFAVRETYGISTGKSVAVVLIPVGILMIIGLALAALVGIAMLGMMDGGFGPGMMNY